MLCSVDKLQSRPHTLYIDLPTNRNNDMTRNDLLKRLEYMQANGDDMNTEIVIRISTRVADKRTRDGYRFDTSFATTGNAMGGILSIGGNHYAEISAKKLDY